jgi:small subunit ribosomal protein S6
VRKSELRRLAYPIKKENEGHYIVINGRFGKDVLPELENMLKLEERLLRYMIIREDD